MGFISYVTFIHMEVSQTHPVKIAFCEYLNRSLDDTSYTKNKTVRNKWHLICMLQKNPHLRKHRKSYLYLQSLVPKVESFEQFLERNVKNLFFNDQTRKKSRSTPCLLNELHKEDLESHALRTSTLDYKGSRGPPPPIPARRNFINPPMMRRTLSPQAASLDITDSTDNTMIHNMNDTSYSSSTSHYYSYNPQNY